MPKRTAQCDTPVTRWMVFCCAVAITATVAALYAHTLHSPWYLDDFPTIVQNLQIRDLKTSFFRLFSQRGVTLFSFALNYRLSGLSLSSYHLVNICIHLLASWLVFLLLKRVVPGRVVLPLLGSLTFAGHPLQTQAVTYVVQRMASLSALLFLLSLYLFVRAWEKFSAGQKFGALPHLSFYLGSLAAGVLAIFAKENTAVLPIALMLFARFFLPGEKDWRSLFKYLAPFLLALGLAAICLAADKLLLPLLRGESLSNSVGTQLIASTKHNSPLNYFVTELSVLWLYIRMLFLPVGQALDHNYPVATTLVSMKSIAAFSGLAGLGCLAFYFRDRRPLLSCGIAWFFLTLVIESSFIPLDPLFEHRLYLPMFGFVLVLIDLLSLIPVQKATVFAFLIVFLALALLTWNRNNLWNNQIAFYEDNLKTAPNSERVMSDLAKYYIDRRNYREAETLLQKAMEVNPESENTYINLMTIYGQEGRLTDAYMIINRGLALFPDSDYLNYGLGMIYSQRGEFDKAMFYTQKSIRFNPDFALGYINIGRILIRQGRTAEAEPFLRKSIALYPDDAQAHERLAFVLYQQDRLREALDEYNKTRWLDPNNTEAVLYTGIISFALSDYKTAEEMIILLKSLNPSKAAYLQATLANTTH